MLIRAREACATVSNNSAYRSGIYDGSATLQTALRALLDLDKPLPVDPDLIEAREICAKWHEGTKLPVAANNYRAGDYDDGYYVTSVVAGIKRGRVLAAGDA